MSQDAQHVTARMSWQEQGTPLLQLECGSAAPGKAGSAVLTPLLRRNLGWCQPLEQLSCSTSPVCREPQNWCQTPQTSPLCCRDVPPQPEDTPESQGLPGQGVALMGRTLDHQGAGLEPLPCSTQAPGEPSASTDCLSLT